MKDVRILSMVKNSFSPIFLNVVIYAVLSILMVTVDPGIFIFVFMTIFYVAWKRWDEMEDLGDYSESLYERRFLDAFFLLGVLLLLVAFFYYSVLYLP